MGNLTDDMTRLRGEVDALRGARGALMQELARGAGELATTVSAMRADFAAAHTAMAKKIRGERGTFLSGLIREVSSLLEGFSNLRGDMARKGRNDREAFLWEMRRQVTGMRKETADDLTGARRAWRGPTAAEKRAAEQAEARRQRNEQLLQEAEARRLKEEQLRQEAKAKRQEEEQRLAVEAEAAKQETERRKMEESPKTPENGKKAPSPNPKGGKGKK